MTKRQFVNFRRYGKGERYAEQFRLLHGVNDNAEDTRARFVVNLIGGCAFALGLLYLIVRAVA